MSIINSINLKGIKPDQSSYWINRILGSCFIGLLIMSFRMVPICDTNLSIIITYYWIF